MSEFDMKMKRNMKALIELSINTISWVQFVLMILIIWSNSKRWEYCLVGRIVIFHTKSKIKKTRYFHLHTRFIHQFWYTKTSICPNKFIIWYSAPIRCILLIIWILLHLNAVNLCAEILLSIFVHPSSEIQSMHSMKF